VKKPVAAAVGVKKTAAPVVAAPAKKAAPVAKAAPVSAPAGPSFEFFKIVVPKNKPKKTL
jgi:hypothetical protein